MQIIVNNANNDMFKILPTTKRNLRNELIASNKSSDQNLISTIDFLFPLSQLFFLLRETDRLIERLLVDVAIVLQLVVALLQLLEQLHTHTRPILYNIMNYLGQA